MKKTIRDTPASRRGEQYVIRNTKYVLRIAFCVLLATFCVLRFAYCPPVAYALQPEPWVGRCVEDVPGVGKIATLQGFECIFRNVVRILTPLAGLALFIMLIVGSFQMLTAGGDPKKVQTAQKTLTSAILGLVVFLGIWFVLKLIKTITGVDVTQFIIPGP